MKLRNISKVIGNALVVGLVILSSAARASWNIGYSYPADWPEFPERNFCMLRERWPLPVSEIWHIKFPQLYAY